MSTLNQITELISPPTTATPVDWEAVEQRLDTSLPSDYKQLVQTYGGGVFDEAIWLLEPDCVQPDYDLLAMAEERQDVLTNLWNAGEPMPEQLQDDARLLPFAYAEEGGQFLYWLADSKDPDTWTVMINEGRGPEWEHHDTTCTGFLLSVLTGQIHSETFPQLPAGEHTFDPNSEILTE